MRSPSQFLRAFLLTASLVILSPLQSMEKLEKETPLLFEDSPRFSAQSSNILSLSKSDEVLVIAESQPLSFFGQVDAAITSTVSSILKPFVRIASLTAKPFILFCLFSNQVNATLVYPRSNYHKKDCIPTYYNPNCNLPDYTRYQANSLSSYQDLSFLKKMEENRFLSIEKMVRKKKHKKSHKMKNEWPKDLLVGIESEIKMFPKDFDEKKDTPDNCSYDAGGTIYDVRGCIDKDSEILFGFKNQYPCVIGWDGVDSAETKNKVYEFRTLGGLTEIKLKEHLTNFAFTWLMPMYQAFHDSPPNKDGAYTLFHKDNKFIALVKKYSVEGDKTQLAIHNQATFSCKFDNLAKNIVTLMNKAGNSLTVTYKVRPALTIFDNNEWVKYSQDTSWDGSAYKYLLKNKPDIEKLNNKQRLLVYYMLSIFKDATQFQPNSVLNKQREDSIKNSGNNYLKARFSFLPKVPEHLWGLTTDDLKHKVFGDNFLATGDLSLPYKIKEGNTFMTLTAESYLFELRKYIKPIEKNGAKMECPYYLSFLDCLIKDKKWKICGNDQSCEETELFPASFFPLKDDNIIVEVRALKNTFLPREKGNEKINIQKEYLNIFDNFCKALEG